MCLYLKKENQEIKTAKKNIFVFKRLRNKMSPIYGYKYEINKLNKSKDIKPLEYFDLGSVVNLSYHSYKGIIGTLSDAENANLNNYLFIIPKESYYYEGYHSHIGHIFSEGYASSNIICLGHLCNPFTYVLALKYWLQNKFN